MVLGCGVTMSRYSMFLDKADEEKRQEVLWLLSLNEDVPQEQLAVSEEHMDALLYMAQGTMTADEVARAIVRGSLTNWFGVELHFRKA